MKLLALRLCAHDSNVTYYDGEQLKYRSFERDFQVKHFGFEGRFEVILGGNSVPNPKPNPDLLFSIMKSTGTKDLVMVGDTTYDLEMANAAGVRAVGVSWGHHPSELLREWAPVVNSVEELKQHLRV